MNSFHHGQGSTEFTFRDSLPDHTKQIVDPFMMFLKGALSKCVFFGIISDFNFFHSY